VKDPVIAHRILDLIRTHLAQMRAQSPPESGHAMGPEALQADHITVFTGWLDGEVLAVGALADLGHRLGELKSMHVRAPARGTGLGRALFAHIEAQARARGFTRLALETGSYDSFAATRAFYAAQGYATVPPFGSYEADPNSTFLAKTL
ncbi:MAG: GNAT family N-acetyltransferase, partial [Pseudomonadota bacterium]